MVSKAATLDAVETVIDQVDETVDTLDRIPNLALNGTTRKQQLVILAATALSAATVAGVVSHLVTKKVVALKYEAILDEELAAAKRHYTVIQEKPTLDEAVASLEAVASDEKLKLAELVTDYNGAAPADDDDAEEEAREALNIFEEETVIGQWNQEVEESKRSEDEPYVISKDEYFEGVMDYTQEQLTYFEGDDTLADEHSKAIAVHESDMMVGDSNLLKFGHGSGEHHVVYVRNDRLETDYEITRSNGTYSKEVAGFVAHSDGGRKVRKFRGHDE